MLKEKERQEEVIKRSPLDWTIVRPPRYTDKPRAAITVRSQTAEEGLER
jgi:uncharacterized protein YbjT (DUF2867 family)